MFALFSKHIARDVGYMKSSTRPCLLSGKALCHCHSSEPLWPWDKEAVTGSQSLRYLLFHDSQGTMLI